MLEKNALFILYMFILKIHLLSSTIHDATKNTHLNIIKLSKKDEKQP